MARDRAAVPDSRCPDLAQTAFSSQPGTHAGDTAKGSTQGALAPRRGIRPPAPNPDTAGLFPAHAWDCPQCVPASSVDAELTSSINPGEATPQRLASKTTGPPDCRLSPSSPGLVGRRRGAECRGRDRCRCSLAIDRAYGDAYGACGRHPTPLVPACPTDNAVGLCHAQPGEARPASGLSWAARRGAAEERSDDDEQPATRPNPRAAVRP